MCYHVYVTMHVNDPYLSVVRVRYCVPLAGYCLSLYGLHVLNRDVNKMQTKKYILYYAMHCSALHYTTLLCLAYLIILVKKTMTLQESMLYTVFILYSRNFTHGNIHPITPNKINRSRSAVH